MNKFCDDCGTILDILENQVYCYRCNKYKPKQFTQSAIVQEKRYVHEKQTDVQQMESRPITDEECPKCGHTKAYYTTRQMRSADEGQTVFYECCNCGHRYKENT